MKCLLMLFREEMRYHGIYAAQCGTDRNLKGTEIRKVHNTISMTK